MPPDVKDFFEKNWKPMCIIVSFLGLGYGAVIYTLFCCQPVSPC